MKDSNLSKWLCAVFTISLLILPLTEEKAFGGGRGGSIKAGSKGSGSFPGASVNSRGTNYKPNPVPTRQGSSLKSKAASFAAGAVGGVAAYSLMKSIGGSHRSRSGEYYGPEYESGETCVNNEDMNGTVFGQFRCPLYGFSTNAKYCCGERNIQYCCSREDRGIVGLQGWHIGLAILAISVSLIVVILSVRGRRRRDKDIMMVSAEPPTGQSFGSPMGYSSSTQNENPYSTTTQHPIGNFNPYEPPSPIPYLSQQSVGRTY